MSRWFDPRHVFVVGQFHYLGSYSGSAAFLYLDHEKQREMGTGQRGMISRHWHWQAPWTHATLPTRVSWNFWQIYSTYDVVVNFCNKVLNIVPKVISISWYIMQKKKRWGVWIFAPKLANYNIASIHICCEIGLVIGFYYFILCI